MVDLLAYKLEDRIRNSALAHSGRHVTDENLGLAQEVVFAVGEIEGEIIPDDKRRPWNTSVLEHVLQVDAYTWVITEDVLARNPDLNMDLNRTRAKTKFHDLGRSATHDPMLHGLVGRNILKEPGASADLRKTTLAHLEAGVGLTL